MNENMNAVSISTVSCNRARAVCGAPAAVVIPIGMVKRSCFLIPAMISLLAMHSFGYQEKAPEEEKSKPAMTDEEREMLKDRELLENLALLKDLDSIEFMGLLNEMDPEWTEKEEAVIPEDKEEDVIPEDKEEEEQKP